MLQAVLRPATMSARPKQAKLQARRVRSACSPKKSNEHVTVSGTFRLLSTASVPVPTRLAPRFQRKKATPDAMAPR